MNNHNILRMDYALIHNDVISILSAVITGGFVLIFIEISNRKNRENDSYRQLMSPSIRQKLDGLLKQAGCKLPTIVASNAYVTEG